MGQFLRCLLFSICSCQLTSWGTEISRSIYSTGLKKYIWPTCIYIFFFLLHINLTYEASSTMKGTLKKRTPSWPPWNPDQSIYLGGASMRMWFLKLKHVYPQTLGGRKILQCIPFNNFPQLFEKKLPNYHPWDDCIYLPTFWMVDFLMVKTHVTVNLSQTRSPTGWRHGRSTLGEFQPIEVQGTPSRGSRRSNGAAERRETNSLAPSAPWWRNGDDNGRMGLTGRAGRLFRWVSPKVMMLGSLGCWLVGGWLVGCLKNWIMMMNTYVRESWSLMDDLSIKIVSCCHFAFFTEIFQGSLIFVWYTHPKDHAFISFRAALA